MDDNSKATIEKLTGIDFDKAAQIASLRGQSFSDPEIISKVGGIQQRAIDAVTAIIESQDFVLRPIYLQAREHYKSTMLDVSLADRKKQLSELQELLNSLKSMEAHDRRAYNHNVKLAKSKKEKVPPVSDKYFKITTAILGVLSEARKMTTEELHVNKNFVTADTLPDKIEEAVSFIESLVRNNVIPQERLMRCLKAIPRPQ